MLQGRNHYKKTVADTQQAGNGASQRQGTCAAGSPDEPAVAIVSNARRRAATLLFVTIWLILDLTKRPIGNEEQDDGKKQAEPAVIYPVGQPNTEW